MISNCAILVDTGRSQVWVNIFVGFSIFSGEFRLAKYYKSPRNTVMFIWCN